MSVLTVVQDVSLLVGLERPTAVFSSTDREWREMQSVANEAAVVIARSHDWQKLLRQHTVTGDGVAGDFPMPDDYDRMLASANLWSSRCRWAMNRVVSFDEWLELAETFTVTPPGGNWIVYGGRLQFLPVPADGETVKFFYVSSDIVKAQDSSKKPAFTTDEDVFVLSERLLKLAIVYLWKQQKGMDFVAELADFEQAMAQDMRSDAGSLPKLSGNTATRRWGPNVWPGTVSG